jgi:hypothetical protein
MVAGSGQGKANLACIGIRGEGLMLGKRNWNDSSHQRKKKRFGYGLHGFSPGLTRHYWL